MGGKKKYHNLQICRPSSVLIIILSRDRNEMYLHIIIVVH